MGPALGATHTVNSSREDPVEAVRAATGSFGADVAIEAVGRPEVLQQAFYARDLAGTVVQVGVPNPQMTFPAIAMIDFFGRGGALKPSWYGDCLPTRDFPVLIDLYRQGRLDLDHFVSETIGAGDVEQAFARMGQEKCYAVWWCSRDRDGPRRFTAGSLWSSRLVVTATPVVPKVALYPSPPPVPPAAVVP